MQRRDVIRAVAAGFALPTLKVLNPDRAWAAARAVHDRVRARQGAPPLVLNPHQEALVEAISEMIIPTTDTPGAAAAQVHRFVDVILAEWVDETERAAFLAGLDGVDARSRDAFGVPFLDLATTQQTELVQAMDDEVTALRTAGEPTDGHFFAQMKYLTVHGYYTSEVGATQEIPQIIAPGRYDPCGPVRREMGGQWQW